MLIGLFLPIIALEYLHRCEYKFTSEIEHHDEGERFIKALEKIEKRLEEEWI